MITISTYIVDSPAPLPRNAKAKVRSRTSVSDTKGIKVTLHYRKKCPKYPNKYHFCKEILIVDPPNPSIDDKQIQIHKSPDGVAEVTTYDHAMSKISNNLDSGVIELGLRSEYKMRGRARYDKELWDRNKPTLPTLLRFIRAAGVEKMEVYDPSKPLEVRYELPVKNQADILYYSGHGYTAPRYSPDIGRLQCWDGTYFLEDVEEPYKFIGTFNVNDIDPSNWEEDLDYFIIAGCAILKDDNLNGFAWANATLKNGILKGLCGYYGSSPSDKGGGSIEIAKEFSALLTIRRPPIYSGDRVLDAWLEANRIHHACGIVYDAKHLWKVVRNWEKPWEWTVTKPKRWQE
jgi:hypothetical protein